MTLKRGQQRFLACLILGALGLLALTPFVSAINSSHITIAKLVGSSGLFLDIAGIIQLEISGAFDTIMDKYGGSGPIPSPMVRQIIDNPDTPKRNAMGALLFFTHRTGIWLLIAGFVLQLSAVWIWV